MDVPENGMFALANAMLTRKIHCVRSQVKLPLLEDRLRPTFFYFISVCTLRLRSF